MPRKTKVNVVFLSRVTSAFSSMGAYIRAANEISGGAIP
jgi:hypothetical protein